MTKKILIVVDTKNWAIDQLTQVIIKHNPHLEFRCYYLHPRDVAEKIGEFKRAVEDFNPDIIHFQYYRSCQQALELCPALKKYPIILTHHNQRTKAIYATKWNELGVEHLVCHTSKCAEMLLENGEKEESVNIIQHGIDLDYFNYSDKEPNTPMIGYVGRVVPWKGLLPLLKVSKELNYPVQIMGKLDKQDYWDKCLEYQEVIDTNFFDCKDEERKDAYRNMTIYVGNSSDGYEEGPLGLLEAWASGVPVVTTPSGEAKDLAIHEKNALVVDFDSEVQLKEAVRRLMEDKDLRQKLRKGGWEIVKSMCEERMARQYSSLYYRVGNKKPLVSVIVPVTLNNNIESILDSLSNQTYPNIEVVLSYDVGIEYQDSFIEEGKQLKEKYKTLPIKFVFTGNDGYGLAMARNMGIIESEGEYLMFNDARLCPEKDAIERFMNKADTMKSQKIWLFGEKGGGKKHFVENFSFVKRADVVAFGMFNERIDRYGGMSQEVRTRWRLQNGAFEYVEEARATELKTSKTSDDRRKDVIASKLKLFKIYKTISY